jgi:molybdopterin-binding protein
MNTLRAKITHISSIENLHLVRFCVEEETFTMMSLDLPPTLEVGSEVTLTVKPTNIIVAKETAETLSCENSLRAKIIAIENGSLLSSVTLEYFHTKLQAIITLNAAHRLALQAEEDVTLFIQASDISIKEILS